MRKNLYLLFCSLFVSLLMYTNNSNSQSLTEYQKAQNYISQRGEVFFCFPNSDVELTKQISKYISIDKIVNDTVFAYSNQKGFDKILDYNIDIKTLTPPSLLYSVKTADYVKGSYAWDYYPTYEGFETMMHDFANDYPDICKLLIIDTLQSGRRLIGVRISDNVNEQENEPEFLYSATMHGDETTGYVLMLRLIDYLLSNYGVLPRVTDIVNNTDIVIFPLANPNGTYRAGNHTVNGATRYNANNVDLNRNYPDPKDGPHPDGNPWQEETIAFMNLADNNNFGMGANFHGGAEVANYPWDTWSKLTADDNWWKFISREYVDTVHKYSPYNYFSGFNNGIINGYQWYSINGGRQDYMNYFQNCREFTLEISNTKLLPTSQLNNHWEYNYRSFLNHIEQAQYGLHGVVTDSITGAPLYAKVNIALHDKDNSFVYTDKDVGDYHRYLKAGTYDVTYSAFSYTPKTFQVTVNDFETTILDVQLYNGALHANFTSDTNRTYIDGSIAYESLVAGNPDSLRWHFEGGIPATSVNFNPVVTYPESGNFSVKLIAYKGSFTHSVFEDNYVEVMPWHISNNKTYSLCEAKFVDDGGLENNYSNNQNRTITFVADRPNHKICAKFNSFNTEEIGGNCIDKLIVYNGADTNAAVIAELCGSTLPNDISSSNSDNALTFQFISNDAVTESGWDIDITCVDYTNINDFENPEVNIYPNPVTGNIINIETLSPIKSVICFDVSGRFVFGSKNISNNCLYHNLDNGVYSLKIETQNCTVTRKVIVNR
ncbi:MAG: M14 family zinc carboxypeptidase [Lentimicrobiaceae bacterium]|nr:M14 family zinc carboxypeptidase [Lentimicrobiaceae bacterium]